MWPTWREEGVMEVSLRVLSKEVLMSRDGSGSKG